ncbi:MAG TPA: hypothetical protein VI520_05425, partial [Anaerolineales bacterium]|nr:hypothetical protein [Anaerolineales bacterium]
MKEMRLILAGLVTLALVLAACAPAPETTEVAPPEEAEATSVPEEVAPPADLTRDLEFIMVQHALCAWDAFWCTVEQGISDAAEDLG